MKSFLKKNLWLILGILISFILMLLGSLSSICLVVGSLLMGAFLLCIAYRFKVKYDLLKDQSATDNNVFDATEYDFDEDIYIVGTQSKFKKTIKQGLVSKFSALFPLIVFSLFGAGLIILSITFIIKIII